MNLEDAVQRWSDTILNINGLPAYVESVPSGDGDHFKLRMHISDGKTWSTRNDIVNINAISEDTPELGMRQVGVSAHYITRQASHQFKRGLVPRQLLSDVVGLAKLFPQVCRKLTIPSPETINVLYNTTYPPLMQVLREVSQGMYLSCAFHKELALGAGYSRWPVLFYKTAAVGLVKGDVIELAPAAASLRELVQDHSPLRVSIK